VIYFTAVYQQCQANNGFDEVIQQAGKNWAGKLQLKAQFGKPAAAKKQSRQH
jgi:hypothetical protein